MQGKSEGLGDGTTGGEVFAGAIVGGIRRC